MSFEGSVNTILEPEGRWKSVLMVEAPLCEFNIAGI